MRVHLLGFEGPKAKASQSQSLIAEADTRRLWDQAVVGSFLRVVPLPLDAELPLSTGDAGAIGAQPKGPILGSLPSGGPTSKPSDAVPAASGASSSPFPPQSGAATGAISVQFVISDTTLASLPAAFAPHLESFRAEIDRFVGTLTDVDVNEILTVYSAQRQIPYTYDARILRLSRSTLGRDLDFEEKRFVRACVLDAVRNKQVRAAVGAARGEGTHELD